MRLTAKFEPDGSGHRAPKAAKEDPSAPSAAARNLALAHHIERLIDRGLIADYTQAARMLRVSQPRMTHLMGLMLLAPAIQEAILMGTLALKDKEARELARIAEWAAQASWHRAQRPTENAQAHRFRPPRGLADHGLTS